MPRPFVPPSGSSDSLAWQKAVNGRPGGVFFPRYQESYLASQFGLKTSEFFNFQSFKVI
jgi:hypothetical protein